MPILAKKRSRVLYPPPRDAKEGYRTLKKRAGIFRLEKSEKRAGIMKRRLERLRALFFYPPPLEKNVSTRMVTLVSKY